MLCVFPEEAQQCSLHKGVRQGWPEVFPLKCLSSFPGPAVLPIIPVAQHGCPALSDCYWGNSLLTVQLCVLTSTGMFRMVSAAKVTRRPASPPRQKRSLPLLRAALCLAFPSAG